MFYENEIILLGNGCIPAQFVKQMTFCIKNWIFVGGGCCIVDNCNTWTQIDDTSTNRTENDDNGYFLCVCVIQCNWTFVSCILQQYKFTSHRRWRISSEQLFCCSCGIIPIQIELTQLSYSSQSVRKKNTVFDHIDHLHTCTWCHTVDITMEILHVYAISAHLRIVVNDRFIRATERTMTILQHQAQCKMNSC